MDTAPADAPPDGRRRLYLIAGEASGDLHGSNLIRALKAKGPCAFRGMGGDRMEAAGMQLARHIRTTDFMGFLVVLMNLRTILRMFSQIKADLLAFKPDAVILIDYPGFNLRMARFCHQHGIQVFYYISPQVWAWKKSRVKQIRAYVDRMYCILPFEREWYRPYEVEAEYVGHPLLDAIEEGHFGDKPENPSILALLPGSRKHEIARMLPVMLQAASTFGELKPVLAAAPTQPPAYYAQLARAYPQIEVVYNDTYRVLRAARYALVTSGTATLEAALHEVPQVVCYSGNWLSYQIARRLVKISYISLVNLIMDRPVVTELIQKDMRPSRVAEELHRLVYDAERRRSMLEDYRMLKERLGGGGASEKAAESIWGHLKSRS
jgi:lipid-A-disaccharide synthase